MSDPRAANPIEGDLRAWAAGDLVAMAAVLATEVTLRAVQPGRWDCADRRR